MLHDLGADIRPNSRFVTTNRRFEVDGAFAARDFIRSHRDGRRWDERRVQLVWDAVAFHSEGRFALFKEVDVEVVYRGNEVDFSGGGVYGITEAERAGVRAEFSEGGEGEGVVGFVSWVCRRKPGTTYGEFGFGLLSCVLLFFSELG